MTEKLNKKGEKPERMDRTPEHSSSRSTQRGMGSSGQAEGSRPAEAAMSTFELLRNYVDPDGILNEDADLNAYAQIMKNEEHSEQQKLLFLKTLVASLHHDHKLRSR